MYTYKHFDNKFIVSIQNRVEITKAITAFVEEHDIKAGAVYGIGAVNEAVLRFYDPTTKEYVDKSFPEQLEISNLTGNISTMEGKPYIHLHITLGRSDYTAITGHLLTANIHGAGELVIEKLDGEVGRRYDDETGLNLYKL
jgi:hypothetical protein